MAAAVGCTLQQPESLPPPKKVVAPTVSQINAEFVTQLLEQIRQFCRILA